VVAPREGREEGNLTVYEGPKLDEKGRRVYAFRHEDGRPACGSPKRRGGYCGSPVLYQNGRCRLHGGPAARGAASGTWVDGKRSRYASMPQHLRAKYEQALQDPELTHHRGQIAMVDAALDDFFGGYESGASPELWKAVKGEYRKAEVANNAGDRHKAREHFEALGLLIKEGFGHSQQSLTLLRLLEARRRHADSETKRRLSESMTFSYEMAYTYYTALGAIARRWFGHDQERLTGFLNELTAITTESGLDTDAIRGPAQPLPDGDGVVQP
jgi:hypothetical protein